MEKSGTIGTGYITGVIKQYAKGINTDTQFFSIGHLTVDKGAVYDTETVGLNEKDSKSADNSMIREKFNNLYQFQWWGFKDENILGIPEYSVIVKPIAEDG